MENVVVPQNMCKQTADSILEWVDEMRSKGEKISFNDIEDRILLSEMQRDTCSEKIDKETIIRLLEK